MPEDAEAVHVGAHHVVHILLHEPLASFLHLLAILSIYREHISLELYAHQLELLVIALLHVEVALRMGKHGRVALVLDALQEGMEIHRGREDARLHQQEFAILAQRQQVVCLQALFEERI